MKMPVAMSDKASMVTFEPGPVERLFMALEAPLLRYAYELVKSQEVAEDIVQETFMRLHAEFENVRQPRPWLYRTAHNLAMNHLRAGRKIVPLEPQADQGTVEHPADAAPLPDERMERMEAIEKTRLCLQTLDTRARELVRLKFDEGLSYKEMSERTGLSVGNVGFVLHHALKRLAAELENRGIEL